MSWSLEQYYKTGKVGSITENLGKLSKRCKKEKASRKRSFPKFTGSSGIWVTRLFFLLGLTSKIFLNTDSALPPKNGTVATINITLLLTLSLESRT